MQSTESPIGSQIQQALSDAVDDGCHQIGKDCNHCCDCRQFQRHIVNYLFFSISFSSDGCLLDDDNGYSLGLGKLVELFFFFIFFFAAK
jgi:hypothetical protein